MQSVEFVRHKRVMKYLHEWREEASRRTETKSPLLKLYICPLHPARTRNFMTTLFRTRHRKLKWNSNPFVGSNHWNGYPRSMKGTGFLTLVCLTCGEEWALCPLLKMLYLIFCTTKQSRGYISHSTFAKSHRFHHGCLIKLLPPLFVPRINILHFTKHSKLIIGSATLLD